MGITYGVPKGAKKESELEEWGSRRQCKIRRTPCETERERERGMLNCYKRPCDEAVCKDLNVIRSNAGDSQC